MQYDYIIVGAGSAGCVLAKNLTEDGRHSVLLIEAGPKNNALSLKIPAAVLKNLQSTKYNWAYQGEPEPELGGRMITHDRGKTLGGSSSINGLCFIRGHALDFEGWQQSGCEGWGYADVLPYFKRLENYSGGESEYRGGDGPLAVHRPKPQNPLYKAFIDAGRDAGYQTTDDICGYRQEGFGVFDMSIENGERNSTAKAYLDPARPRQNLTVITDTQVQKIIFNGKEATGISYKTTNGAIIKVDALKEVILSAGAVGSPQLLMLSGVGPASHLKDHGITIIADMPGVGQNLNDHPDFVLKYRCLKPVSIWPQTRLVRRTFAGIRWLLRRDGICASNQFEAVACVRSAAGVEYPDIQLTISPAAVDDQTWKPIPEHAFQIHVGLMRGFSRGNITLRNADPASPPRILANYLKDPRDRDLLRKGIRIVREIVNQPSFKPYCGDEMYPGVGSQSDDDLDTCIEEKLNTQWHLSGTARMGSSNNQEAVVDPHGKVHGLSRIRIVDASIMPAATNGNTNSPTIMIAEKLSDSILGKNPLPRIEVPVWQNKDYETCQR